MTFKKKLLISLGVLLAVALVAGLTSLAASSYGSKTDPLVALSYLDNTVTPEIMGELEDILSAKAAELENSFNSKLSSAGGQTSGSAAAADGLKFSVVSLSSGQTVTCSVGTEIMLRIGSAVSAGSDVPRLIDETTGSDVAAAGTSLTKNHMYMVTINGNGIKATSSVKIVIRGEYTIS